MLGGWTGRPPRLWRRYIDDIIFLWSGSKEELTLFIQYLNQFHPTIKFKCNDGEHFNFESKSVNFLDTTLYIDSDGFIQSTLYTKPGKLCQYLLPSSSHPNHMSHNIPYSLAYRLLRIESVREKLFLNLQKLRCDLIIRKYNPKVIQLAFDRVLALTGGPCVFLQLSFFCQSPRWYATPETRTCGTTWFELLSPRFSHAHPPGVLFIRVLSSVERERTARSARTLPVGVHFLLPGHSHADLQFTPIEKIQSKDPYVRRIREMLFIQQFETLKEKGTDTIEHGLNLHN